MPLLIARQSCIGPAIRLVAEIALALLLGKIKMNGSRSLNQAALSCDSPPVTSSTNAAFPSQAILNTSSLPEPGSLAMGTFLSCLALPWRPSLKLMMPWLPPLINPVLHGGLLALSNRMPPTSSIANTLLPNQ